MTKPKAAGLLEKIGRIIPGIAGYQDREKRRDADQAVRSKAADEVAKCRDLLSKAMSDLSRSGGLQNLRFIGGLERVSARLERTEDELRLGPTGYAGWFDREGVTLDDLENLYEYDLGLLSAACLLEECVGDTGSLGTENDWTSDLEETIDNLREAFSVRKRVMQGREDNCE